MSTSRVVRGRPWAIAAQPPITTNSTRCLRRMPQSVGKSGWDGLAGKAGGSGIGGAPGDGCSRRRHGMEREVQAERRVGLPETVLDGEPQGVFEELGSDAH